MSILAGLALFLVFSISLVGNDPAVFPEPVDYLNYSNDILNWSELQDADGYVIKIYDLNETLLSTYSTTELQYNIGTFMQSVYCDLHGTNEGAEGDPRRKRID
jgi:hypothetical protein